uniref:Uncharacterized protein n=1 Tax=Avena sativa TaxID=4498 RepID=A0ACD6AGZ4_AVESA
MAMRLSLKKSCSQVARSGALFRVSAPAAAAAPAARPFLEGGVRSLSNDFSGVVHPREAIPNNNGLHGLASRYLNTFTSSCSRTGVTSVTINHGMKSASLHPATRRTFSSKKTTNDQPSIESQIKASGDQFRRNSRNASNAFVVFCVLYSGALIHNRPRY